MLYPVVTLFQLFHALTQLGVMGDFVGNTHKRCLLAVNKAIIHDILQKRNIFYKK